MIREKKDLTINQKRLLAKYEREVRKILFNIKRNNQKNFLPNYMSVSFCKTDKNFQTLKIFLILDLNKENLNLLSEINKNFSSIVKHELARTKMFSRVPNVSFSIDKEFQHIEKIEKLLKED